MTKLYVYCLSDEATPAMIEAVEGVDGAPLRLVQPGNLKAVVSDFAGDRISLSREHVEAHNRVNAYVLTHTTPLPFRFGTLISRTQLESYVLAHEAALAGVLARVSGAVEMSLKILWDVKSERIAAENEAAQSTVAAGAESAPPQGVGAAFLAAKRRELNGEAGLKERAEELRAWLAGQLGELIREERVTVEASKALVLRAAHLVERMRLDEYGERLRVLREEQQSRLRFLTSGAWPPYSFSEV